MGKSTFVCRVKSEQGARITLTQDGVRAREACLSELGPGSRIATHGSAAIFNVLKSVCQWGGQEEAGLEGRWRRLSRPLREAKPLSGSELTAPRLSIEPENKYLTWGSGLTEGATVQKRT